MEGVVFWDWELLSTKLGQFRQTKAVNPPDWQDSQHQPPNMWGAIQEACPIQPSKVLSSANIWLQLGSGQNRPAEPVHTQNWDMVINYL